MNAKKPWAVELICKQYCSYYKPEQEENTACQGFTVLQDFIDRNPTSAAHFPPKQDVTFNDQYHQVLHHILCRHCDFLIDGCDFADPQCIGHPLPCGGYVVMDVLLQQPSTVTEQFLKSLVPEEVYVALGPNCALKHLERPCLYDIRTDQLYEVDKEAFDFLRECDGKHPLSELSVDQDFLEFCLKEGLLVIGPRTNQRRFILRPSPVPSLRYLELQVTRRCNLKCKHCYLGEPKKADLPLSHALSLLEEFEQMQGLRVLFSGGEPLLYRDLRALNNSLPRFRVRKVLLTNGTLITEQNYSDWCHFDEIQFSLDGLKEGHEAIRGPTTFDLTVHAMNVAQDKGIPISIATMVHRYNLEEFEDMARLFEKRNVVEWNIDVPCATGRLSENPEFLVTPEEGATFLKYATGGSLHCTEEPFACGYHLCTVTAEGDVLKCGFFDKEPLGSLQGGLEASWRRTRHLRISQLECAPCPHLSACKGGCRFRAGGLLGKDPVMCALYGLQNQATQ